MLNIFFNDLDISLKNFKNVSCISTFTIASFFVNDFLRIYILYQRDLEVKLYKFILKMFYEISLHSCF